MLILARPNTKVIVTLNNYEILRLNKKGYIFFTHSYHGNCSFSLSFINKLCTLLQNNPNFRANFTERGHFYPLIDTLDARNSGRPNTRVLAVIEGIEIFKPRELGQVFLTTSTGVSFTLELEMLNTLYYMLTTDANFYALFM